MPLGQLVEGIDSDSCMRVGIAYSVKLPGVVTLATLLGNY